MKLKLIFILLTTMCSNLVVFAESTFISSGKEKNQLVELFTSEGCSSCPPADKWISQLKDHPRLWSDIVPIAFHVDYWDGLGWKDDLASNDFSQRQRLYREQGSISQVYTPGFVVDGKEWRGFFRRKELEKLSTNEVGELSARVSDKKVVIQFTPVSTTDKNLVVNCAVLGFDISNEIAAGENRGKTLVHDFAVLGYNTETVYSENNDFILETNLPEQTMSAERKALVVWISEESSQLPLQAAGNWL